jgi:hypothetical protein
MRKAWSQHSLTIILFALLVVVVAFGTWATWVEFSTNEGLGMEGKAVFWSWEFLAFWSMQLLMNYAPGLMGAITLIFLSAKLSERFRREDDGTADPDDGAM